MLVQQIAVCPPAEGKEAAPSLQRESLPFDVIVAAVVADFGVTRTELIADRRSKLYVEARGAIYDIARRRTALSVPQIGARMGGRDHTTVLAGVRKARAKVECDPQYAEQIAAIEVAAEMVAASRLAGFVGAPDASAAAAAVLRDPVRVRVSDRELAEMAARIRSLEAVASASYALLRAIDRRADAIDNWRHGDDVKRLGEVVEATRQRLADALNALDFNTENDDDKNQEQDAGREPAGAAV